MSDVLELLHSAKNYLIEFDNHLILYGFAGDARLGDLIEKIEQTLKKSQEPPK